MFTKFDKGSPRIYDIYKIHSSWWQRCHANG